MSSSVKALALSLALICLPTTLAGAAERVGSTAASAAVASASSASPVKDKWAVVVGISNFANPSLNLKFASKDATDFKNFLVTKCNFAPDHVRLLTDENATKDKILDVLGDSWLPRVTLPEDLVVIYISSHGSPSSLDVAGVNYVVAHDTNPDKLFTTGIPLQHLADTVKERVHSERVLIVLDACHSGAAGDSSKGITRQANVDAQKFAQGTGQAVICSSSKNEASWEAKNEPNGVFTKALIESLQAKGANTRLGEAFALLKDKVQSQVVAERGVMQTPVLEASRWKGDDFLIAAIPTAPRLAPALKENSPAKLTPAASSSLEIASKATATLPTVAPSAIPDITGDFAGNNGFTYHYWQKGRKCGWEMPLLGTSGKCTISDDGRTMVSTWTGLVSGQCGADLLCDDKGRVLKVDCDNGIILTRVEFGK